MRTTDLAAQILDRLKDAHGEPARRISTDPVRGLVGTILSQNTSDSNSERALASLVDEFPDWEDVLAADVDDIEDAIRSGGLAAQKAPTIQRAIAALCNQDGTIDATFLDEMDDAEAMAFLTGIRGIGQKTASCVLLFDFDRDVLPVDTHVHRVSRRIGLVPPKTDATRTQILLEDQVAPDDRFAAHVLFIRHGRTTCKARSPKCSDCTISDLCEYASHELERTA